MPIHASKHADESPLSLSNFMGGENRGTPPTELAENECEILQNFYLEPSSGKPRTRLPLALASSSAPAVSTTAVTGLYFWNSSWYFACNQTLYFLDAGNDPKEVGGAGNGALNGTSKPTFLPFNGKLLVASGGVIQTVASTSAALVNTTSAPKATYLIEKDSRVYATGDSDNPDRVWGSGYFTHTDWTPASLAQYIDIGYKDKLSITGIHEFRELFVGFKRGNDQQRTFYFSALSTSAPAVERVSEVHCARSHYGVVDAAGVLYMLEEDTVTALLGVDAQGKLAVDPNIGRQVNRQFSATASGFAVVYPPDKQIWFFPDPSLGVVYICHYMLGNVWTTFKFTRKFHSAFYRPSDATLYLGADDGFIYKYNKTATAYTDSDGSGSTYGYTGIIRSRIWGPGDPYERVVKDPIINYEVHASGAMSVSLISDYGRVTEYSEAISTVYGQLLADLTSTYLYDTQVGGSSVMYLYDQRDLSSSKIEKNIPVDNFQIELRNTSGGITLNSVVARVAVTRLK